MFNSIANFSGGILSKHDSKRNSTLSAILGFDKKYNFHLLIFS